MNDKPIFSLHLTFEDAMKDAKEFQSTDKDANGKDFSLWADPHDFYDQRMTLRTDVFYPTKTFDRNLKEMFEVRTIEEEAKAALLWLIRNHNGFNPLELGQIIVGVRNPGFGEDKMVAIFAYISKADDCLRDFITELAYGLTT